MAAGRSYVIGLGANLGHRLGTLSSALEALGRISSIRAVSALYETAPVGPPQPDFLNAAVLVEGALQPHALLEELLRIERAHGRERRERWGPRTLDLDLLHSPDLVIEGPGLTLPHPELVNRAFALVPLLDVAPDARDARSGTPYADVVRRLDTSSLRRLPEGLQPGWNTSAV